MDGPVEHMDVLQNLEFAVVQVYRANPQLTDFPVTRVYEALIDAYTGEKIGREPRPWNPSPEEVELYEAVRRMCETRLGRMGDEAAEMDMAVIDIEVLINCLKRLRKSVIRWNKRGGPQGYLDFIEEFV